MFTGIVQEVGQLRHVETRGEGAAQDRRLEITHSAITRDRLNLGDSICVAGVCLTVAGHGNSSFLVDVSGETLRVTTLGAKLPGALFNLEPALRAGDSLGGHWVSGHVDGTAEVISKTRDARSLQFELAAPRELARYIARKGSVCIDGVSLTVNDVAQNRFGVNLIPHTLEVTTLGECRPGTQVNVEVDIIARYVERMRRDAGDDV